METLRFQFRHRPVWTDLRPFFLRSAAIYYALRSNAVYFWRDIFTIELIRRIYSPRFQGFVQPWHSIEFSRNTQSWQCWHFCTISNGNRSTLDIVDSWIRFQCKLTLGTHIEVTDFYILRNMQLTVSCTKMPIWQLCVLLENSNGLGLQYEQIDTSIV